MSSPGPGKNVIYHFNYHKDATTTVLLLTVGILHYAKCTLESIFTGMCMRHCVTVHIGFHTLSLRSFVPFPLTPLESWLLSLWQLNLHFCSKCLPFHLTTQFFFFFLVALLV